MECSATSDSFVWDVSGSVVSCWYLCATWVCAKFDSKCFQCDLLNVCDSRGVICVFRRVLQRIMNKESRKDFVVLSFVVAYCSVCVCVCVVLLFV